MLFAPVTMLVSDLISFLLRPKVTADKLQIALYFLVKQK